MLRPCLLVLCLTVIHCSTASGQGYFQRHAAGNYSRSPSIGVFGIGTNTGAGYPPYVYFDPNGFNPYVYDPYTSGSFQAPDLLNDPYFRERHRYQSHFPRPKRRSSGLMRFLRGGN